MKDAYSFDVDRDALMRSYRAMYDAYTRSSRAWPAFRAVEADTGAIGGFASHEFQVLADSGEDAIAWCRQSQYAANVEQAERSRPRTAARGTRRGSACHAGMTTCEKWRAAQAAASRTAKSIMIVPATRCTCC